MSTYNYTKQVNLDIIKHEIGISAITIALDSITLTGVDALSITFKASISASEETVLTNIVTDHVFSHYTPQDPISVEVTNTDIDEQGRQVSRIAAATKGWTYLAHPIEFETSKIASLYEKDASGANKNMSSIKFYNASDVEVTDVADEATIVKSVMLFKPPYDYELVAGSLEQMVTPPSDLRIWVLGGIIELGGAYVKEFASGLNMRFYGPEGTVKTDGRAAKFMKKDIVGVPYQANQLQIIVKHEAGVQHRMMMTLEYFRN